jgi:hypothetical protein
MKRALVGVVGSILLGVVAGPAEGQGLRVVVGVNASPVSMRLTIGTPAYLYPYRPVGVWVTDPYLARLHRRHVAWIAREQARLDALRRHDREYRTAVRAFERHRMQRERAIERAYWKWHEHHRGGRR